MEVIVKKVTLLKNQTGVASEILKNVSFNLKSNNIYAFIGESSSGKTNLCELLAFLQKPSHGFIRVGNYINNSINSCEAKLRYSIGYLSKKPGEMFVCNTVKKELMFSLKRFKYNKAKKEKKIIDIIKMVGLNENYLEYDPLRLNLNEQKKLALACILIYNPKIIIIDEPTIGLNSKEKKDLIRLLNILKNKYKKMIIIMSKDTDFIYSFVSYVYILSKGEIVASGEVNILSNSKLLNKYSIKVPEIVKFVDEVKKKRKKFNYYNNLSDLIKAVYRNAGK